MATLQTVIELRDNFSNVANNISRAASSMNSAIQHVNNTMSRDINTSELQSVQAYLDEASNACNELNRNLEDLDNNPPNNLIDGNNRLVGSLKTLIASYLTLQSAKKLMSVSDEFVSVRSRINNMNDGLQTTQELMDMVYVAAQNSRGSFNNMADVVARFGNNAKDAFNSTQEVIAFSELVNKEMVNGGAGAQEAANAMLQLSQALGSGVLRGDELNSILEQAPNLIGRIQSYIEKTTGKSKVNIREIAQEGKITADIVKNAIFSSADAINKQFASMPVTWSQTFTMFGNQALFSLQPLLDKINEIANNQDMQAFISGIANIVTVLGSIILNVMTMLGSVFSWISENWSVLQPIFFALLTILGVYMVILTGIKIATIAVSIANFLASSTFMLIFSAVVLVIGIIFALAQGFANMTGIASSGFGIICGGINWVIEFFRNLSLAVANIGIGIGKAMSALGSNIVTAFGNAIKSVQGFWYDLLSTALGVVESICSALNKLPFIEFDYSGISAKAQEYANKSQEAYNSKSDYKDISDAFSEGMNTYETFSSGWSSRAFKSGVTWGDGVSKKLGNKLKSITGMSNKANLQNASNKLSNAMEKAKNNALKNTAANTGKTAKNTAKTANAVSTTAEDLKYLRDIASADIVNKFTTASITVKQTNHNNVNSNLDLDGITEHLRSTLEEQLLSCAEGVY